MVNWLIIIFGSLYILLSVGAMFYIIRRGLGAHLRGKRQDRISVRAKVADKIDHQGFHAVNWQVETVRRLVVFECEDGEQRDYDVPDGMWDHIEEGDVGELTFQGHHFIDFHCRRHRRHLDKTHDRLMRR